MNKIEQKIFIKAPRAKVWEVMLSDKTYREWTGAFTPGSYFVGDWSEGSKMLFLGPDPEGKKKDCGMVSMIAKAVPQEFVSIKHLGIVDEGVEDTTSPSALPWAGIFENYTFRDAEGGTEVVVEMDIMDAYKEEFNKMWATGLQRLKEICEA